MAFCGKNLQRSGHLMSKYIWIAFWFIGSIDYGFVLPIASIHLKGLPSSDRFSDFDMWQDLLTKVSDQAEQIVRLPSDYTTFMSPASD